MHRVTKPMLDSLGHPPLSGAKRFHHSDLSTVVATLRCAQSACPALQEGQEGEDLYNYQLLLTRCASLVCFFFFFFFFWRGLGDSYPKSHPSISDILTRPGLREETAGQTSDGVMAQRL